MTMGRRVLWPRTGAFVAVSLSFAACSAEGTPRAEARDAAGEGVASAAAASTGFEAAPVATREGWEDADWTVFSSTVRWALSQRLDSLPTGDAMAALGRRFVGTAYVPHTLEPPGPERVVIDFRGLDCVTFVENVLALTHFIDVPDAARLVERREEAEAAYEGIIRRVRYRDGRLDGYRSRLHYFTDWIADGEAKGLVSNLTREIGGVRDVEPVDFMSTHIDAYRQLGEDPAEVAAVRSVEERLTTMGRWYVPEYKLEAAVPAIRDGDIIAATSTVPGLDVAHTGLAIWVDGTLRLMHAPLVGDSVQISEEPLADRIRRIRGQDGIMVARPTDRR